MNWGYKITIGFLTFVLFMIGMVVISMRTDFFLVEDNYYEEELAYQEKIESQTNGNSWTKEIKVVEVGDDIQVVFQDAKKVTDGTIQFFRPSDARLDFSFPIVDSLKLPKKEIVPGKWLVNLKWEFEGKRYVRQQILFVGS